MKTKGFVVLTVAMLVGGTQGADKIDCLKELVSSVTVTSAGLALTFPPSNSPLSIMQKGVWRRPGHNEEIVLAADGEAILSDGRHVSFFFTPVAFKNGQKGFRITDVFDGRSFGREITTNNIVYLALSDMPMQVGEGDVESEIAPPPPPKPPEDPQVAWLYKRAEELGFPLPERTEASTPTEPQAAAAEDAQPEAAAQPRIPWPYALIPLALLAIFYFMRRKRR